MITPDFIIPGAGKSGTSSLTAYLAQHPRVCMSKPEEPMFFSHDRPNALRLGMVGFKDGFDKYSACFSHCSGDAIKGEGSTSYMFFPGVLERLEEYVPDAKFVFIFRNPVNRVYSHYNFNRQYGSEDRPLCDAFEASIDLDIETWENRTEWGGYYYYYQNGLSGKWLDKYISQFGGERIYVISFESLMNTPLETTNGVFRFLDVDAIDEIHEQHANKTRISKYPKTLSFAKAAWRLLEGTSLGWLVDNTSLKRKLQKNLGKEKPVPTLTEKERIYLADYFRDDVSHLKKLTGRTWSEWTEF